jgi:hypothetical protein
VSTTLGRSKVSRSSSMRPASILDRSRMSLTGDFRVLLAIHLRRILLDLDRMGAGKQAVLKALRVLKTFTLQLPDGGKIAIDVDPLAGSADSGNLSEDVTELLVAAGEAAAERRQGLLLSIDEVQYLSEQELAKPGAANGTLNRELAILSRMLRLAYENGKLLRVPVIRKLKEADPRSGFFEPEQFASVRKHLPDDLQAAVTVAYTFGWRMQSEVLALERRHLDLDAGTLRLDPA